jgi:hypothetical protein
VTKDWKTARALQLLYLLESRYPELIHSWDSRYDRTETDADALINDIVLLFEKHSQLLSDMGIYQEEA